MAGKGWSYDTQGYASYQSGAPPPGPAGLGGLSSDFSRLCQTISSDIQKMVNNVSQIEKMITLIGTMSDNPELRDKLHKLQHETHQLAKGTSQQLKVLSRLPASRNPVEQRQIRIQKDRLMNDFTTVLKNFQSSQREQKEREKNAIQRARNMASPTDTFGEEELVNGQLVGLGASSQLQTFVTVDDDIELLHDREKSVQQLEADIMDVNQIFKDLSVLVHEQGEVIDSIEANVESASLNVSKGGEQLKQANKYATKLREKKCCLAFVIFAVVVILIIIIAVSVKH